MTTHALTQLSNTTATRLTPNGIHSGMDITIQNLSDTAYVYLGGEGTSSQDFGYRLSPNSAWSVELPGQDAIYAVSDIDETYISVLQTGLETGN